MYIILPQTSNRPQTDPLFWTIDVVIVVRSVCEHTSAVNTRGMYFGYGFCAGFVVGID